ncbi:polyketide cyclase [Nocardioides gansuensis]|uniref:Polyketide cyclase n=1 Tax=Nocardioides gansuensis TaxID=2138300 RepID=A0A2T8F4I8_9ACTN|nr:SRPBCC family protein [Nocardioides gansuensis]PVG80599.1 polyketide cyclase [Nocardioides gansuensis]
MTEHHVSVQRTIAAPVEDVWTVIDNTARYAEWVDGAFEVRRHHGAAVVGRTYEERNRTIGPLTTISTWTVQQVEPKALRVDTGEGFAPLKNLTSTFRFVSVDDGRATEMTYEVTFRLSLGPLGRLVGAVLSKSLAAELARSMANLDELLRSERPLPGEGRRLS